MISFCSLTSTNIDKRELLGLQMIEIPSQTQTRSQTVTVDVTKIIVTLATKTERICSLEDLEVFANVLITKKTL